MIITITGTIPDNMVTVARDNFVKTMPIPKGADGNDLYTFTEWLNVCVKDYIRKTIQRGKRMSDEEITSVSMLELENIIM